jgi:hypothetical protein
MAKYVIRIYAFYMFYFIALNLDCFGRSISDLSARRGEKMFSPILFLWCQKYFDNFFLSCEPYVHSWVDTKVSEKHPVSIFSPEEGECVFLRNVSVYRMAQNIYLPSLMINFTWKMRHKNLTQIPFKSASKAIYITMCSVRLPSNVTFKLSIEAGKNEFKLVRCILGLSVSTSSHRIITQKFKPHLEIFCFGIIIKLF